MKKALFAITLGLLAGLIIHPPQNVHASSVFRELVFPNVKPGASVTFPIPETQEPIYIAVSFSLQNGGTQTPSEVMYAVVNQDNKSSKFSWIGTNNDGSVQVGTSTPTGSSPLIARICGGPCPTTNAMLEVNSDATLPGTLKLTVNSATVAIPATFNVSMLY